MNNIRSFIPEKIKFIYFETDEVLARFKPLMPVDADYNEEDNIIIGAIDIDKMLPIGIIVCSANPIEIVIEHLYVEPRYRGIGIGTVLVDKIKELVYSMNNPIGITCAFPESNEELFKYFFLRPDMMMSVEGREYRVSATDLQSSPLFKKAATRKAGNITSIQNLARNKNYIIKSILASTPSLDEEDLEGLNEELSLVVFDNRDKIEGFLLVANRKDKDLEVVYAYTNEANNTSTITLLLANALVTFQNKYSNRSVYFTDINNDKSYSKLIPGITPIGSTIVARWNYDSYLSSSTDDSEEF